MYLSNFKGFRLMPPTLKIKVSLALEAWLEAPRNDFWAAWGQSLVGLCEFAAGAGWIMLVSLDFPCSNKGPNLDTSAPREAS